MKVLLDIKDSKVPFVMELLRSFSFVKVKPLTDEKAEAMGNLRDSIEELKLIRKGKLEGIPAKSLLDEI